MAETKRISLADEPLTETDKKRILKDLQKREQSPSARHQSNAYQYFQEQLQEIGTPYDVTRIPISVLQQMERDPMISFGLHFIRTPIMRARWYVKCERADIASFIDNALRKILPRYISQHSGAWNYGFKPIVKRFQLEFPDWRYIDPAKSDESLKVWDNGSVKAVTWKHFTPLPSDPQIVEPRFDGSGNFSGIKYQGGNLPFPFASIQPAGNEGDESTHNIPLRHSLWVTNEKDSANGSLWGYPRVGYAYRYWWSYWFRWALYDRFFERKADPPYKVYYPTNTGADYTEIDEGEAQSMKAIALSLGDAAKSGGTLALPGETIKGYDDRPTSIREWDIDELEVRGDFSGFKESFEYLDVMKLRSLWIPEQAFLEGKGGTSSRNVAGEEISIHKEGAANESDALDEHINRYIIPDLVTANFPEFEGECIKVTTGFTDADMETLESVLQLVGQGDPGALANVDIREVFDRMGLPLVNQDVIKKREQDAVKAIEEEAPPPVLPEAGKTAGVNQEGLYIQQPAIIALSEDEDFIDGLPNSRHYSDKTIRAATRQLRKRWRELYPDVYEDFAEFISKQDLSEVTLSDEAFAKGLNLDAKLVPNKPKVKNWVERRGGLPKPIADIAGDLISEKGFTTSHAIATAVNRARELCAKGNTKYCKAIAQWEKMKKGDLSEIEDALMLDESEDKANDIVDKWKYSRTRLSALVTDSQNTLKRVINRAGNLELRRANLKTDWNADLEDVAQYLEDRGAVYVKAIDETTRNELKRFLADQIRENGLDTTSLAAAVREHFHPFPDWKADRLARTEIRDAYNFAQLAAGERAGVKIVQAKDAQHGETDHECEDREGKFFKIGDALSESLREHPNGTLEWVLTKRQNLSVERVEDTGDDDKLAYFDDETDTIYLSTLIPRNEEVEYLYQLGKVLENED